MKNILLTGGTGYIASHTAVSLIQQGYQVVLLDNLSNSKESTVLGIESITGIRPVFEYADVTNLRQLRSVFEKHYFSAVIHFAGLKAVGESVANPLHYYQNNVLGSSNILSVMAEFDCKHIVFSSSCTVYGKSKNLPLTEASPLLPVNPYGRYKLMVENMLEDLFKADPTWVVSILRYFNPAGAHPSGLIGEDPLGAPGNLLPYTAQVASGKRPELMVYGDDYDTVDGTGVRDYVHVCDVADAHVRACVNLNESGSFDVYNVGTGRGHSVLEVIAAFEKVIGQPLPFKIIDRRPGDVSECYANPQKITTDLQWCATYGIHDMAAHLWNWQQRSLEFTHHSTLSSSS